MRCEIGYDMTRSVVRNGDRKIGSPLPYMNPQGECKLSKNTGLVYSSTPGQFYLLHGTSYRYQKIVGVAACWQSEEDFTGLWDAVVNYPPN